jgi:hypothetical protein
MADRLSIDAMYASAKSRDADVADSGIFPKSMQEIRPAASTRT